VVRFWISQQNDVWDESIGLGNGVVLPDVSLVLTHNLFLCLNMFSVSVSISVTISIMYKKKALVLNSLQVVYFLNLQDTFL